MLQRWVTVTSYRALWVKEDWEHQIRDDADYARQVDYVHYNPVKHGLIAEVRDWFHRYVRLGLYRIRRAPCCHEPKAMANLPNSPRALPLLVNLR